MEIDKVGKVLNSEIRRKLLHHLTEDSLSVNEAVDALESEGSDVRYRQTVYRALEDIKESGLAEKNYEDGSLQYKLLKKEIKISFENMEIS